MTRRIALLACFAALIAVVLSTAQAGAKFNKKVEIGQKAPVWKELKGTDGKTHGLDELKKAKLVVVTFTCNHCPVAAMYEDRFISFAKKYKEKGVEFVAVSCSKVEGDGFDEMKKRANEKSYPFPYLQDADQSVGRSYGAFATPHLFVLDKDRKIAYMGAFDDNMVESETKHQYLTDAVDSLLAGKRPEVTESRPHGCSIEYEKKN